MQPIINTIRDVLPRPLPNTMIKHRWSILYTAAPTIATRKQMMAVIKRKVRLMFLIKEICPGRKSVV